MSDITVEIELTGVVTAEISLGTSIGANPILVPGTINIVKNVASSFNTNQSTRRPVVIEVYDQDGKRITKNLPEPTVILDTTWRITYPVNAIGYSNVSIYYL